MSARDELTELIRENRAAWVTNSEHRQMEEAQADAIAAAGFRKVNNLDASAVERVANVLIEDGAFGVPWGDASEEDRAEAMDKAHVLLEAAGHAMPRTITTAEELDALPVRSVLLTHGNKFGPLAVQKVSNDEPAGLDYFSVGMAMPYSAGEIHLPATVLHEATA